MDAVPCPVFLYNTASGNYPSTDRKRLSAQQKFEGVRAANPYGLQHLQGAPGTSPPQYSRSHPGVLQQ
ncbi:hypothetical protein BD410DRAFT_786140 [Rickenella mellea]|uniref:Uncharacterized protein n=1 Tax=Rickenella mellea TaxID=50990 RepID=A0A4Y7QAY8_9AGAM|nr:hypothetical protein BD410DRAFT_786140 [Rickenella mellea]